MKVSEDKNRLSLNLGESHGDDASTHSNENDQFVECDAIPVSSE
jgi:hypothetical protein